MAMYAENDTGREIEESRRLLDTTLALVPSGILFLDEDLRVRVANDWYRQAYGISDDEPLIGEYIEDVMRMLLKRRLPAEEDAELLESEVEQRLEGFRSRRDSEFLDHLPDGRIIRVDRRFVDGVGFAVVFVDVTEFTRVEDELKRTRLLLEKTFNSAPVGILVVDEDSRIRFVNGWFRQMYEFGPDEEIIGLEHAELIRRELSRRLTGAADHDREIIADIDRRIAELETRTDTDFDDVLPNGRIVRVMRRHPVGIGCVVSFVDLTEVRNAEAALQAQRQLLDATIENAPVGIAVLDEDLCVRLANSVFVETEGYADHERLIGMNYEDVLRELLPKRIARAPERADEMRQAFEARIERLHRHEDDAFEAFVVPRKIDRHYVPGVGFIITEVDVSDLKRAENELRRTLEQLERTQQELVDREKMAALGNLVGGLAHEINTPVGVCVTASSHLAELLDRLCSTLEAGDSQAQAAEVRRLVGMMKDGASIIERNLQRAAGLVGSFKQVAIDQTADDVRGVEINAYIEDIIHSLAAETRRAKLDIHFEPCTGFVNCYTYPGAIAQILTNLIMNAIFHAYEQGTGGRLDVEIRGDDADSVTIVVRDFGKGMSDETKARVFEPFFTTERGRGGTGLGLHIAYNLATQRLGGSIRCESREGEGTEFVLCLPRDVDTDQTDD